MSGFTTGRSANVDAAVPRIGYRTLLLGVLLGALAIRLALVAWMPADSIVTPLSSDTIYDARAYAEIGRTLAQHGEYGYGDRLSAFRPPLYPWFLGGIFAVAGEDYRIVRIVQAVVGALACLALAGFARRLFGRLAGILAGTLLAAYPFVVYFTSETLTETFFIALMAASFYLVVRTVQEPSLRLAVAGGIALGLGALCRPPAFTFALAVLAAAAWMGWQRRLAIARRLGLCGLVAVLAVAPWCVRNSLLFGQPTFLTSYSGLNLYKGLPGKGNESSIDDLGYCQQWIEDGARPDLPASERDLDGRALAYWLDYTRANPAAYLAQKAHDVRQFWFDFALGGSLASFGGLALLASMCAYLGCLGLAVAQTVLSWRRRLGYRAWVPWLIIGLAFATYLPFFAGKRFRVASVDPYLIVLAASFLADRLRAWGPWPRLRSRIAA